MRITLIGSGNVASVLGRKIYHSGHIIQEVFSRNKEHATLLADQLAAKAVWNIDELNKNADICIIAIPDASLSVIHQWLSLGDVLTVHTAGSVPMDVLKEVSSNYGVLYPLQTLRKELDHEPVLPMLTDANNAWNKTRLSAFAQSFADSVGFADDMQRAKLHLAAVITNNFSNHLLSLAEEYCSNEGIDFQLIVPLVEETAKRIAYASPGQTQTGPAIRGDETTIAKHLEMLGNYPKLRTLYEVFTKSIVQKKGAD